MQWDKKNDGGQGAAFEPDIQVKIDKISQWMQHKRYTTKKMHELLDTDGNGEVDAEEFITGF